MGRQNPAIAMYEGKFRVGHLSRVSLAAQLPHRFDDVEHAARRARMRVGQ